MRKGLIIILACTLFLAFFSFLVSANTEDYRCVDNGISFGLKDQEIIKQGQNYFFSIHPYNSSDGSPLSNSTAFCAYHLYNSNGSHIIANNDIPFGTTNYDFILPINGGNFTELGYYPYVVSCFDNDGTISGTCSGHYLVTQNGDESNYTYLIASFILIVIFLGFSILIYLDKKSMSDEKYWDKMFQRYNMKNYVKLSVTIVWYNLKRNSYVLHYLIGFVIMLLVYDITYSYSISIYPIFKILLALYSWGAVFIAMILLGNVQEWIMEWKEELEKINWGDFNGGK